LVMLMTVVLTLVAMTTFQASFASDEYASLVATRLAQVQQRITAVSSPFASPRIVGVTKTFGPEAPEAACLVGLHAVGENYVEELELKRSALPNLPVSWHYLGALQSNKIARIVAVADVISGVSRMKEIDRIAAAPRDVMIDIQVDFTHAPERNGAAADEVPALVGYALSKGVHVRGLMTIAPVGEGAGVAFRETRALADELGLLECSMGMTEDLELAIEAGSTELRLGRALFGSRTAQ
jgi:PLP dependent protein